MTLVTIDAVRAASQLIQGRVYRTPMVHSKNLSARFGVEVYLKLEAMQKTGSFKVRGGINRINSLTDDERKRGVVALSAGNHAQGVAWAATNAGVKSTFVMPANAVQSKVEATRNYGGEVIQTAGDLMSVVKQLQAERGLALVHPFDDPHVIAGAGTVANEIFDDLPNVDAILFGIGGGGLAAGTAVVARARRKATRVIGIEPDGACAMRQSLDSGKAVYLDPPPRTAVVDALGAPFAGALTFEHVRDLAAEVYVLPDALFVEAMWLMMERCKVVTEPAAAAGIAALIAGCAQPAIEPGSSVAIVVSGGNVDRARLKALA
ncbi:MAG: threonine/serine dehydratase [Gemmatimonadetes bacterium]|nr:threonine/serine dehydratase [Gemmatimonadota bacterium]